MPTLLCIDDQETSLAIRQMFLEAQGYSVLTASDGRAGLELLASNPVDALILDYRMPRMDGEQVAREARRLCPQLPIIMLSGYVSEFPEALHDVVDACLVKGGSPEELLVRLADFLGAQPKTPHANPLEDLMAASREQVSRARARVATNRELLQEKRARKKPIHK